MTSRPTCPSLGGAAQSRQASRGRQLEAESGRASPRRGRSMTVCLLAMKQPKMTYHELRSAQPKRNPAECANQRRGSATWQLRHADCSEF